jgi:hypothetical protein
MTYLSAVIADAPTHFWRLADPGGEWLADIGSARPEMMLFKPQANGSQLGVGYSGPNSDSGSMLILSPSYAQSQPLVAAFPFTIECCVFQQGGWGAFAIFMAWDQTGWAGLGINGATPAKYVALSNAGDVNAGAPSKFVWDHLAAVYTAAATTLYVNGVNVGASGASQLPNNKNLYLGRTVSNTLPMPGGNLSEVAIYPTALSAARIAAHFNALTQRHQTPVFNTAGGTGDGTLDTSYTDIQQAILGDLFSHYKNNP